MYKRQRHKRIAKEEEDDENAGVFTKDEPPLPSAPTQSSIVLDGDLWRRVDVDLPATADERCLGLPAMWIELLCRRQGWLPDTEPPEAIQESIRNVNQCVTAEEGEAGRDRPEGPRLPLDEVPMENGLRLAASFPG